MMNLIEWTPLPAAPSNNITPFCMEITRGENDVDEGEIVNYRVSCSI